MLLLHPDAADAYFEQRHLPKSEKSGLYGDWVISENPDSDLIPPSISISPNQSTTCAIATTRAAAAASSSLALPSAFAAAAAALALSLFSSGSFPTRPRENQTEQQLLYNSGMKAN